jgi:BirA family transcriptional regulator, biotin operon repressor / biotin---[acetyl-CoA-carboxylase] ligase
VSGTRLDAALLRDALRQRSGRAARDVAVHAELDSTSSELVRRIAAGAAGPGSLVIAEAQTAGRGRLGRAWASPPGNLYASLAVAVGGPPEERVPLVPLAAGVAAVDALAACGVSGVRLKWPNDLIRGGRKVGGVLCEAPALRGDRVTVVVGLGVNTGRAAFEGELAGTAGCLGGADPGPLIAVWVAGLEVWAERISSGEVEPLVAAWLDRAEPFGRRVRVDDREGTTVGLDAMGRLLVEVPSGEIVAVFGGIVEDAPPPRSPSPAGGEGEATVKDQYSCSPLRSPERGRG